MRFDVGLWVACSAVLLLLGGTAIAIEVCSRGLYLDKGELVLDAPIAEVLDRYNADYGT